MTMIKTGCLTFSGIALTGIYANSTRFVDNCSRYNLFKCKGLNTIQ